MNFHEYQAKDLFAQYGIVVPGGKIAESADGAVSAAKAVGGEKWVVKAQVHAGGRGKAGFVKLVNSAEEATEAAHTPKKKTSENHRQLGHLVLLLNIIY